MVLSKAFGRKNRLDGVGMSQELTVLLIEDDPVACDNFRYSVEEYEGIRLVAITNKISQGLSLVQEYMPNVVLLDLELHNGEGNGLEFLSRLKELSLDIKPYIFITTNNSSQLTYRMARKLGADMVMYKYQEDYSEKKVLEILLMVGDILKEEQYATKESMRVSAIGEERHIKRKRIYRELDALEMSPRMAGYKYLADAIMLSIDKTEENICDILAKKYKKTPGSIDKAMRNAINTTWNRTACDILFRHYTGSVTSSKGSPTVMEFVTYYTQKINCE